MRDIKFRAWNKEKNIMCYRNEDLDADYWDGVYASILEIINDNIKAKRYIFMQYTGLKDKNGKEIYEADIVKQGACIGVIKYGEFNCSCCDGVYGWFVDTPNYTPDIRKIERIEVIGNIYDNPKLLEDK